jgi:hypothetical protein
MLMSARPETPGREGEEEEGVGAGAGRSYVMTAPGLSVGAECDELLPLDATAGLEGRPAMGLRGRPEATAATAPTGLRGRWDTGLIALLLLLPPLTLTLALGGTQRWFTGRGGSMMLQPSE